MHQLVHLFQSCFGEAPAAIAPVVGAGSSRRYYRFTLADGRSCIGTVGTSAVENEAFMYMSRAFAAMGLPVPEVLAVSEDGMRYLQSDAGPVALFDLLAPSGAANTDEVVRLLGRVMDHLAAFHNADCSGFDFSKCYPRAAMDHRSVMWDLNYFKYCYLKPAGIEFDEERLEDDFATLASLIGQCGHDCIMLRDCQSRNVMVAPDGDVVFIDFQGARRGNSLYDVVSFLWQARAAFSPELRRQLFDRYLLSCGLSPGERAARERRLPLFVLLRTLQVLGAYGFQGLIHRKEHFVKSIPAALDNLRSLLEQQSDFASLSSMPELLRILQAMVRRTDEVAAAGGRLVVTVGSFAYKMGLPVDNSGNGGGFVFDCRALHNPGRYDKYKPLTGMDGPVIEFLESRGEVGPFLDAVYSLVDTSVERYQRRGFTSLSVAFGCTGGRHRSVYCAERLADHLAAEFPDIMVRLIHREQKISRTL